MRRLNLIKKFAFVVLILTAILYFNAVIQVALANDGEQDICPINGLDGQSELISVDTESGYPALINGEWISKLILITKSHHGDISGFDFVPVVDLYLNLKLLPNLYMETTSVLEESKIKQQELIGELNLFDRKLNLQTGIILTPDFHKGIIGLIGYPIPGLKLSSFLLGRTDHILKSSYRQGLVMEARWESPAGLQILSRTGIGTSADKNVFYKSLGTWQEMIGLHILTPIQVDIISILNFDQYDLKEQLYQLQGNLVFKKPSSFEFFISSKIKNLLDYSWTVFDFEAGFDWFKLGLSGIYGMLGYDVCDNGLPGERLGLKAFTPHVYFEMEKAALKVSTTYLPRLEDIDGDGLYEKLASFYYRKTAATLSASEEGINLEYYLIFQPKFARNTIEVSKELEDFIIGAKLQFEQNRLDRASIYLTSKF